ncbi:MAG: PAS domain-containing sensor histidine kinase, partial [Spirochaetia bacterium]|nr:PAS domain-containing sensor histidine kinase [Spirochaetia bacterium]
SIFYNVDILQLYCRDLFFLFSNIPNSYFQLTQTSKQEVLAFILVDIDGSELYHNFSANSEGRQAQMLVKLWMEKYRDKTAGGLNYIPPLYISKDLQMLVKILPVWQDGHKVGTMGVGIDIGSIINKYSFVSKLGFSGAEIFLDGNGTVIADIDKKNIGRSISEIRLENINSDSFPAADILSKSSGNKKYKLFDSNRNPHQVLVAWDSFKIGEQRIIAVTGASETVINKAILEFHTQAVVLGILVTLIIGLLSLAMIFSRQTVITRSLRVMNDTINERTKKLMLSEKKYQAVFHGVNDGLVVIKNKRISYFNGSTTELLGYSSDELYDKDPFAFIFDAYEEGEDYTQKYRELAREAMKGKSVMFETILLRKDGSLMYAEVALADLEDDSIIATLRNITLRKKAEKELRELNAQLERRVSQRTEELESANGALKESLVKLKETQQSLVEAGKMASLGVLVAGVAHEVNTPVGIGVTAASLLQEQTNIFEKKYKANQMKRSDLENYLATAKDSANVILENLRRASERISSFKQVAVDQTSQDIRKFNLKEYVAEILVSIKPAYKKTKHTVVLNGDDDVNIISAPGAFSQIFTNLVMNSLKHGFEGVEAGIMSIDISKRSDCVEIIYADNGVGMSREIVEKIFDPFFTTKRGLGGSGLGMNIVYNLVTRTLGGDIRCESSVGGGSRFYIRLPYEIKLDQK